MIREYIEKLSNPILYYVDKSKNSVFRNFCLFKETGYLYKTTIPKANAGKALEYRFELDKYLKWSYFLIPVILYLIFIHTNISLGSVLFFEFLWIILANAARLICSYFYNNYLLRTFGQYEVVEFSPKLPKEKKDEFVALFRSKIIAIFIVICLFFIPAFILKYAIKLSVTSRNKFPHAIKLSNTYFAIYPKSEKIYDMRAYAKYRNRDIEGSLEDYKTVLNMSGDNFTNRDYVRFANLLYLQKKVSTPTDAIDVFNEYITKKRLSTLETSQMLWIKSIFKIENNIPEGIIQEYDDLISALDSKDTDNQFYLSADKAYILYLMGEYASALDVYNIIVSYAQSNPKKYSKQLKSILAERGFTKQRLGDTAGATMDFSMSQISPNKLSKYEPAYADQEFVVEKF